MIEIRIRILALGKSWGSSVEQNVFFLVKANSPEEAAIIVSKRLQKLLVDEHDR